MALKSTERCLLQPDRELIDTGCFDKNRYFDVFIEYAKNTPEDILIEITVINRGDKTVTLHLLPTLWFRNTWSWANASAKPVIYRQPPYPVEAGSAPLI